MAKAESVGRNGTLPDRETDWLHPQGILEIPKGVVACHFCGFTRFRRSKMRLGDAKEFLLMRLPVRCGRCNQRQYVSMLTSSLASGVKNHDLKLAKGRDTWKNWTEQEMADKTYRPMTTALGPRATKLRMPRDTQSRVETQAKQQQPGAERKTADWRDDDRQIW